MVRRTKRLWTDEEKLSICLQATSPEVSVVQVPRRYAPNANMIFKWLRDARYALGSALGAVDAPALLPVVIVNSAHSGAPWPVMPSNILSDCLLEIEIAGGHRLRASGSFYPEVLARLLRGLSG